MSRKDGHRHRIHGNPFSVRGEIEARDWDAEFDRQAPIAIDVGFGRGQFVIALARKHPEWNVVGIEIRQHLVDRCLEDTAAEGLRNVRALVANANLHFDPLFPDGSVQFVSVNFPDPWFKKRHHKRRVVQASFLDVVARKMTATGEFHAMSDYEPIAQEMLQTLEEHPSFDTMHPSGFAKESTTGIETEREVHHSRRGAAIHRMAFRFNGHLPAHPSEI